MAWTSTPIDIHGQTEWQRDMSETESGKEMQTRQRNMSKIESSRETQLRQKMAETQVRQRVTKRSVGDKDVIVADTWMRMRQRDTSNRERQRRRDKESQMWQRNSN